jgi:DNA polymerase III subunit epsilon
MLIVGVDVETTGLSPVEDRITEIGAVAWDTIHATPVGFFHRFIRQEKPLSDLIKDLTGLNDEILATYGIPEEQALKDFTVFMGISEYMVAHNAPFDKRMIEGAYLRHGQFIPDNLQWIDTVVDVPYPAKIKSKSLVALAAEHRFLNPFPHRAVTDVLTMMAVASNYDWAKIIANACEPKVTIWAKTTFAEKDKAKSAGFYWNGDKKIWTKNIFLKDIVDEADKCNKLGFEVQVINDSKKEN